jgi:DNA-directed RNA polymerase sigma subunit (sigma70/sigma32)
MVDLVTEDIYEGVSFMPEEDEMELLHRACSGDAEAKLQLVKNHLNLVVELAAGCAAQTGKPFPQMVQAGALAVIRAAGEFDQSQQVGFGDYVKSEIARVIGNCYH